MDWVQIIIFIIVFLFPVISKILGGDDGAKANPKPARRQARPQPPVRQNVPQGGQPAGGNALENEIEEFLRRAPVSYTHLTLPTICSV